MNLRCRGRCRRFLRYPQKDNARYRVWEERPVPMVAVEPGGDAALQFVCLQGFMGMVESIFRTAAHRHDAGTIDPQSACGAEPGASAIIVSRKMPIVETLRRLLKKASSATWRISNIGLIFYQQSAIGTTCSATDRCNPLPRQRPFFTLAFPRKRESTNRTGYRIGPTPCLIRGPA